MCFNLRLNNGILALDLMNVSILCSLCLILLVIPLLALLIFMGPFKLEEE